METAASCVSRQEVGRAPPVDTHHHSDDSDNSEEAKRLHHGPHRTRLPWTGLLPLRDAPATAAAAAERRAVALVYHRVADGRDNLAALEAALDAAAPHADELTRAIADKNGVTPLWRAARFGHVKCVALLLDRHPEWRDVPTIDKQQAGGRRGDISEQLQFVSNSSPTLSSARA